MKVFLWSALLFLQLLTGSAINGISAAEAQTSAIGITAHRGDSANYPENTLAAFQSALNSGVDWIETDVYKTADHQLVLIHDSDTFRTAGVKLNVEQTVYAELAALDYAAVFRKNKKLTAKEVPFGKIPLLEDALELIVKNKKARISLQPKNECVDDCIAVIKKMKAENWTGFNDGSLKKMSRVKELAPKIPVFWDLPAEPDLEKSIRIARAKGFEALVLHYSGMTASKAAAIKKAGLIPGVWTLNDPQKAADFMKFGVERFYTDNPNLLLKVKADLRNK